MADMLKTTKTIFTVSQFLDWRRQGTLDLSPIFQRRPVWKKPAKSLLIDTVIRGYPLPIILLRQVQDLENLTMHMEVVDGQQRLRTLLAYIDPSCLDDFDESNDTVTISQTHNSEFANMAFSNLSDEVKQSLLNYELSTHIFPNTTGDELVYRLFARLNSTGLSLNPQEIRNSEFHGAFKSLVYDLSFENLDLWRQWGIFSNLDISRMQEAEAVSESLIAMIQGVTAKSQPNITRFYKEHEELFPSATEVRRRFRKVLREIDDAVGDLFSQSAFRRSALFYSLFAAIYHHMYGLRSNFKGRPSQPRSLPKSFRERFEQASQIIQLKDLSEQVQDAMDKATGDKARRDQRHQFIMEALGLEPR
ncbi:MAG: DUF262 domain-containing protein [Defluviicoccus sp.]|nr:DUF262 domain-containing protein [Defluviicoccus sp.]